jgi:hypothetical protein
LRRAISAGSALLLSGCSLINPHVTADMERPTFAPAEGIKPGDTAASGGPGAATDTAAQAPEDIQFAGGVGTAIDYANSWRTRYYEAVGDQSKLKNGIAIAVIPASAAALYFGISGNASRDVIAGLATGAAGLLGLGIFLESDDRQRVYLAGHEALGCVILASAPLLVPQDQFDQLRTDVNGWSPPGANQAQITTNLENSLVGKIAAMQQALSAVDDIAAKMREKDLSKDPALVAGETEMAAARQLISDSSATLGAANAFINRISGAEPEIVARVDNVVAKVSEQITKTEPDIAAITQITGGLSSAAGRIATIPPPKAVAKATPTGAEPNLQGAQRTEAEDLRAQLATALGKLRATSSELASIAGKVRAFLTAQDERTKAVGKIEDCGLNSLAIGVQINPPDTAVTLTPGQNYSVIISGGKRPYSAVLSAGEGVALSRGGFDQQPVVATVSTDKDKVKDGNFSLAIGDATDEGSVLINFTVTGATASQGQGGAAAAGGVARKTAVVLTPFESELNKDPNKAKIAQFGAGMKGGEIDGKIGNNTHIAVIDYHEARQKEDKTGAIDEALYRELAANADAHWTDLAPLLRCPIKGSSNTYECTELGVETLVQVQETLHVPATGEFDEPTRNAIKNFQSTGSRPDDRQQLSEDLVSKIQ